jgi:hypothetical protein
MTFIEIISKTNRRDYHASLEMKMRYACAVKTAVKGIARRHRNLSSNSFLALEGEDQGEGEHPKYSESPNPQ